MAEASIELVVDSLATILVPFHSGQNDPAAQLPTREIGGGTGQRSAGSKNNPTACCKTVPGKYIQPVPAATVDAESPAAGRTLGHNCTA
jgi:hypothetical protein